MFVVEQSYLRRAKQWVETAEDVDIENLESTLARFSLEHKKHFSNPIQDESKLKDLGETIEYLKSELKMLAGVDDLPAPSVGMAEDTLTCASGEISYNYDPSPLVDISNSESLVLSESERHSALLKIMNMPGITSAGSLSQCKRGS